MLSANVLRHPERRNSVADRLGYSRGAHFSSSDRPAEAKFPTVRYLAAPWIGYRFKTSSLPVAGLDCTGWRVSSEMGGSKVRIARNTEITISRQASGPLLQYGDDHQWLITNMRRPLLARAIKAAGPKMARKIDRLSSSCRLPPHRVASKNRSPSQLRLQGVQRQTLRLHSQFCSDSL
jgi:hypothetical protein